MIQIYQKMASIKKSKKILILIQNFSLIAWKIIGTKIAKLWPKLVQSNLIQKIFMHSVLGLTAKFKETILLFFIWRWNTFFLNVSTLSEILSKSWNMYCKMSIVSLPKIYLLKRNWLYRVDLKYELIFKHHTLNQN